jgi:hypothetical protein
MPCAPRGAMLPEEGQILTGPQFSEPARVETVKADGPASWVFGVVGIKTERFRRVTLIQADLAQLPNHGLGFIDDAHRLVIRRALFGIGFGVLLRVKTISQHGFDAGHEQNRDQWRGHGFQLCDAGL